MLLFVRLCAAVVALRLCGQVSASRNRIKHPGQPSSGNPPVFQTSHLFQIWLTQPFGSIRLDLRKLVNR